MENLAEIVAGLASLGVGGLAVWVNVLRDEVKSLRRSRHDHGNAITGLQARIMDLERDVMRLRDGKRNGG